MRKAFCALVLTGSLTAAILSAQEPRDNNVNTGPGNGDRGAATTAQRDNDRGFNPGWLGLIGLAGLAGLMPKDRNNRQNVAATNR